MKTRILILLIFCVSCSTKQTVEGVEQVDESRHSILVLKNTFTVEGSIDTLYYVDDTYFEMGLTSITNANGRSYLTQRKIEDTKQPYRNVTLYMIKPDSSVLRFNGCTDFLNYMDSIGYEMENSKEHRYGWDYVFKKKAG